MAGYSGTPLIKKLGIKPGAKVALDGAPKGFTLDALPEGATLSRSLRGKTPLDVVLLFATTERDLGARVSEAKARIAKTGGVWVCWPKKASGMKTDLSDGVVREIGLGAGLVDNKVCAIDDTWSGLRFVWRLADR
ncbi:MAG: DUF3052 family protein [Sandaracinaceae bacterium]